MRFLFLRIHQLVEEIGTETKKSAEELEAMQGRDPMKHRGRGPPRPGDITERGRVRKASQRSGSWGE